MVYIASDHAGFDLKNYIIKNMPQIKWNDLGPSSADRVDYPDYAKELCKQVLKNTENKGVLICGSGIGMSIQANRFKGIRAALCLTAEMSQLAREHNNANILCLGSRLTSAEVALEILNKFLLTEFSGGRHQTRIEKLDQ